MISEDRRAGGLRGDVVLGTLDQGAAAVLAFLFHALAAAVFPVVTYGWLVLVWGAVGFGVLAWRAVVGVPFVVRYSDRTTVGRESLYALVRTITSRLQWVLVVGAAFLLVVAWIRGGSPSSPTVLFAGGGVILAAALLRELWRHRYIADLDTRGLGWLGTASNLTAVAAFAVASVVVRASPLASMLSLAAGLAAGALLAQPSIKRAQGAEILTSFFRTSWAFGRHIMLGVASTSGATQVVLWALLVASGEGEVAVFGAVMALAGLPRPAMNAVTAVLTPRVAGGLPWKGRDAAGSMRWIIVGGVVAGGLILAGIAAWLGPPLMRLLFPSVPVAGVEVMVILAIGIAAEGGNAVFRGMFRGSGRPEVEARCAVAGAGVGLLSTATLVPIMGITGAAVAVSAIQVGFFVVSLVTSRSGQERSAPQTS